MTGPDSDTDAGTDMGEMIAIDVCDAGEIAELCRYLAGWITAAPPAVTDSLNAFGGRGARRIVLETLDRVADTLVRAVPSVTAVEATVPTALGYGETVGLAELLIDLAERGWPDDPVHGDILAIDCGRWARRLTQTPATVTP